MTLQDLGVSNAYEISGLMAVRERKGVRDAGEVPAKITRYREKSVKAR